MDNKTEFILSSDGKIIQREIKETEKVLTADALNTLSNSVIRHIDNVFSVDNVGSVNCHTNHEVSRFVLSVPYLPLKAPYVVNSEGIMHPAFSEVHEPIFDLKWYPVIGMKLKMVIEVWNKPKMSVIGQVFLITLDESKRCYVLPMGNLYKDCKVCMGKFDIEHSTARECVIKAWEQFCASGWNGDLDANPEEAARLFRFKPNKDGFEQLEPDGDWRELCQKVAPPVLNFIRL